MIYILDRADKAGIRYDECFSKVIRARSEQEARDIANASSGDEGQLWTDPVKVTCEMIEADGASGTILEAFKGG